MFTPNKAAYLLQPKATPFTVSSAPSPDPATLAPRELIIRVHAVAINPVDAGIQDLGFLWPESDYPLIIGSDVTGIVTTIGSEVERIKVGDRVMACVEKGGFQQFCVADERMTAEIPEHVSFKEAAVLPLGLSTAAVSLFHPANMGLAPPTLDGKQKGKGKTVVVWGGSSSVGSCGIQILRAAGYSVVATAGAHNASYCKELGASEVLDHKDDGIVENIVQSLDGKETEFAGIFSAIMTPDVIHKCAAIADRLGKTPSSRVVGTVIPPVMPFTEPVPDGIRIAYCACGVEMIPDTPLAKAMGMKSTPNDVGPAIWERWAAGALEKGSLRCKPDAEVVGTGLEGVQVACDRMRAGVSARKMVVEIL